LAVKYRPLILSLGQLVVEWFSSLHTLELLVFELGPTPLEQFDLIDHRRELTGRGDLAGVEPPVEFGEAPVELGDIGFERVLPSLQGGTLVPEGADPLPDDAQRRLRRGQRHPFAERGPPVTQLVELGISVLHDEQGVRTAHSAEVIGDRGRPG
jgi:hypothetical protein